MLIDHSALTATETYPTSALAIPEIEISEGAYTARFARNRQELDQVLKLRFEVFNLELGEGLDSSFQTGRDCDEFDAVCHHLIVVEEATDQIVGTYRLQTGEMAARGSGFYSAGEFDLSHLPSGVLEESVELGRACISRTHRNVQVLFLLWKGLAAYLLRCRKRYLFGCCSLTSQDPNEGKLVFDLLEEGGYMHASFFAPPRKELECYPDGFVALPSEEAKIPQLFRIYLRYGAKVCGPPAIDRLFKTIDYFVLFDLDEMDDATRKVFFGI